MHNQSSDMTSIVTYMLKTFPDNIKLIKPEELVKIDVNQNLLHFIAYKSIGTLGTTTRSKLDTTRREHTIGEPEWTANLQEEQITDQKQCANTEEKFGRFSYNIKSISMYVIPKCINIQQFTEDQGKYLS